MGNLFSISPEGARKSAPSLRPPSKWAKRVRPDHANQLDLFSGAPIASVPEAVPEPGTPEPFHERYEPSQQPHPRTLEGEPAADGGRTGAHATPHAGVAGSREPGSGSPLPVHVGAQDAVRASLGTGDARMPAAAGAVLDDEPEPKPSRDFRINESHRVGQGSLQEKAR